jgi:hypothetical protein
MGNDEHSQNVFKKAIEGGSIRSLYCDQMSASSAGLGRI